MLIACREKQVRTAQGDDGQVYTFNKFITNSKGEDQFIPVAQEINDDKLIKHLLGSAVKDKQGKVKITGCRPGRFVEISSGEADVATESAIAEIKRKEAMPEPTDEGEREALAGEEEAPAKGKGKGKK